jgi:hypothetical protein
MTKLDALKNTNKLIHERIDEMTRDYEAEELHSIFDSNLIHEILYEGRNEETSFVICRLEKGQRTEILVEEEFKRIICLKGKLKIYIQMFDEVVSMSSPNGILIPPNTEYSIEVTEDCELIGVYKPQKPNIREKIINKGIYKEIKDE